MPSHEVSLQWKAVPLEKRKAYAAAWDSIRARAISLGADGIVAGGHLVGDQVRRASMMRTALRKISVEVCICLWRKGDNGNAVASAAASFYSFLFHANDLLLFLSLFGVC